MILVRHGQSEFNVVFSVTRRDPGIRDPRLTDVGRSQAADAARYLLGRNVNRVITSPYMRALETADIIARALKLDLEVQNLVGEHAKFTCDIGTPCSQLKHHWPMLELDHLEETWWPEIGEGQSDLDARCRQFREAMRRENEWAGTVVVTHWGFIGALTGHNVKNGTLIAFDPTSAHPGGGSVVPLPNPC